MSDDLHMPLKFGEAGPEIQRLREENQHIRGAHEDCRAQWTQMATHNAEQAAEITRLRAELATARLVSPLNPDRWRGAINDALTGWMHPIFEDEVPKDALHRLIQHEITAALDPAVSQSAADLVATARREGMEEAAQRLEELHKNHGYNPQTGEVWRLGKLVTCPLTIDHSIGYYRAIAEGVAHIRAAAGEGK